MIVNIKLAIFSLILMKVSFVSTQIKCEDPFESYKNEKCYTKVTPDDNLLLQKYDETLKFCKEKDSTPLTIRSKEELEYFTDYIFDKQKVRNDVWLGLKMNNKNQFEWEDATPLDYTNWENGSPYNKSGYKCVELLHGGANLGKWETIQCDTKNIAVCEKAPTMDANTMATLLSQMRKELTETKTKLNAYMKSLNKNYFHLSYFIDSDGKNREFIFPLEENLKALVWDESKKACAKYNASLVEVKSAHKQQILELFLGQLGYQSEYMNCFMLNAKKDVSGKFKWQKSGQDVVFNKWVPNNPISEVGKDYLLVYTSKTYFGKWQNTYNNTPCYTLCEQEVLV